MLSSDRLRAHFGGWIVLVVGLATTCVSQTARAYWPENPENYFRIWHDSMDKYDGFGTELYTSTTTPWAFPVDWPWTLPADSQSHVKVRHVAGSVSGSEMASQQAAPGALTITVGSIGDAPWDVDVRAEGGTTDTYVVYASSNSQVFTNATTTTAGTTIRLKVPFRWRVPVTDSSLHYPSYNNDPRNEGPVMVAPDPGDNHMGPGVGTSAWLGLQVLVDSAGYDMFLIDSTNFDPDGGEGQYWEIYGSKYDAVSSEDLDGNAKYGRGNVFPRTRNGNSWDYDENHWVNEELYVDVQVGKPFTLSVYTSALILSMDDVPAGPRGPAVVIETLQPEVVSYANGNPLPAGSLNDVKVYAYGKSNSRAICLPGDINGDGSVDVVDLLDLGDGWGGVFQPLFLGMTWGDAITASTTYSLLADINLDGAVDVIDQLTLAGNWGLTGPVAPDFEADTGMTWGQLFEMFDGD